MRVFADQIRRTGMMLESSSGAVTAAYVPSAAIPWLHVSINYAECDCLDGLIEETAQLCILHRGFILGWLGALCCLESREPDEESEPRLTVVSGE